MKTMIRLLAAATLCALPATANAAVTYDIQNGKLMAIRGLPGVVLNSEDDDMPYTYKGITYRNYTDVEFIDGSCRTLLQGCDINTSGTTTRAGIRYVQRYLVDNVLVDGQIYNFNSDPSLVNGCSQQDLCQIFTGIVDPSSESPRIGRIDNRPGSQDFATVFVNAMPDFDTTGVADATYARLTFYATIVPASPVPEPATWALMLAGFGLTGAALRRRRVRFAAVVA